MAQDSHGNSGSAGLTMQEGGGGGGYQPGPVYPGIAPGRKFKKGKKKLYLIVYLF
jgi:hypothetical protein